MAYWLGLRLGLGLGIWELGYGTWNLEQGNVEVGSRN